MSFLYGFKAARQAARAAATAPWPSLPLALPRRPGQRRSAGAKSEDRTSLKASAPQQILTSESSSLAIVSKK
jgi:hypothetical protein